MDASNCRIVLCGDDKQHIKDSLTSNSHCLGAFLLSINNYNEIEQTDPLKVVCTLLDSDGLAMTLIAIYIW